MRPFILAWLMVAALGAEATAAEKTIYSGADIQGVVTITEDNDQARRTVSIDGQPVAWTGDGSDRRALLPYLLLADPPSSVLQLGLTNGVAVGAAVRMGAPSVTVVEPNAALLKGLLLHSPALSFKGVAPTVADPKRWLKKTDERFDLISLRPTVLSGMSDPFPLLAQRLTPTGSVALTLPLGAYEAPPFIRLVGRFTQTFPHVTLWFGDLLPARGYVLLLGSMTPQRFDRSVIRQRLADLKTGDYFLEGDDADSLLSFYLNNERGLSAMHDAGADTPFVPLPPYTPEGFARSKTLFTLLASYRSSVVPMVTDALAKSDPLDRYFSCRTRMIGAALIGADGKTDQKIALLDEAATFGADDPHLALAYYRYGMAYYRSALYEKALPLLLKAKRIDPTAPQTRYALGQTYEKMMRYDKATAEFDALKQLAPDFRQRIRIKPPADASKKE